MKSADLLDQVTEFLAENGTVASVPGPKILGIAGEPLCGTVSSELFGTISR
jgi:hypothetical protein